MGETHVLKIKQEDLKIVLENRAIKDIAEIAPEDVVDPILKEIL